ncbi:MAG: glycoside hydrolase family 172 protein [Phycisphaerales bacterium]
MMRLGLVRACVLSAVCLLASSVGAQTIAFDTLLREMVNRDAVLKFPDPAFTVKQVSSGDPKSTSPSDAGTWFANDDKNHFVRIDDNTAVPGGKEFVMIDADGPGAIVRLWSANPPDDSTLRFYADGGAEPVLQVSFQGFTDGRWKIVEPLSSKKAKGFSSYLPIPYAKHIKVTCDKDGFYYQINYRTYAPGTTVQSFSEADLDKNKSLIDEVQAGLINPRAPFMDPTDPLTKETFELAPGATRTLSLPPGPGAVRYIAMGVRIPDDSPSKRALALQNIVIEAEFDGNKTVWVPLVAFFGGGVGHTRYEDWYRNMHPGNYLHSRFVMPYKSVGKISLTNTGKTSHTCVMNIVTKPFASGWDDRTMYFHAAWKFEYPIHTKPAAGTRDYNFVEIQGKGIFLADNLCVMNPVGEWWGEGDEKIYVDGETFPSHFGTGTEDYYGYAWGSNETFEHPFHAQVRCDGKDLGNNWGYTALTRTRSLDAIPFTKSFKFDMEVWHWKECDMAYGSTVYFYAQPGATINIKPMPEESAKPFVEPPPPPAPPPAPKAAP